MQSTPCVSMEAAAAQAKRMLIVAAAAAALAHARRSPDKSLIESHNYHTAIIIEFELRPQAHTLGRLLPDCSCSQLCRRRQCDRCNISAAIRAVSFLLPPLDRYRKLCVALGFGFVFVAIDNLITYIARAVGVKLARALGSEYTLSRKQALM